MPVERDARSSIPALPCEFSGCENYSAAMREAFPDLGAEVVDRGQLVPALDVPVGPAVAGLESLSERAGAVDRADLTAELHGTVCTHHGKNLALGVEQLLARLDHAALDQRRERHARGLARRHERCKGGFVERFDLRKARLGRGSIGRIAFDPDELAAEALCGGAGRAGAAEWIEDEVARAARMTGSHARAAPRASGSDAPSCRRGPSGAPRRCRAEWSSRNGPECLRSRPSGPRS